MSQAQTSTATDARTFDRANIRTDASPTEVTHFDPRRTFAPWRKIGFQLYTAAKVRARVIMAFTFLLLVTLTACDSPSTPPPNARTLPLVTTIPMDWDSAHVTMATMGATGLVAVGLANGEVVIGSDFAPDGAWIPALRYSLGTNAAVKNLLVSTDALILVALQEDGHLSMRRPIEPDRVVSWRGINLTSAMALSPDKTYLVVGGLDEEVLDTVSGETVGGSAGAIISTPSAYSFSDDSAQVLEVNSDYASVHVRTHPYTDHQAAHTVELARCTDSVVHLTATNLICGADTWVLIYRLPDASMQHAWVSGGNTISAVTATPDVSLIVAGTVGGAVVGWPAGSDREAFRVKLGGGRVSRLNVSADGQSILVTQQSAAEITALSLVKW